MRAIVIVFFMFLSTGLWAQKASFSFENKEVSFTGDKNIVNENQQILEFNGNVHFTTSVIEIEKADKIVYDKKTKTFTISGFNELTLNGKKRLASDFGSTTLKVNIGGSIAYLIPETPNCKGKDC